MSKPKKTLYVDDQFLGSVTKVIVNRIKTGDGGSKGDTLELHGSPHPGLSDAARAGKLVTFKSGKITIKGYLQSVLLFRDQRYKTKERFLAELRPNYDSRNRTSSWEYFKSRRSNLSFP